MRKFKIFYSKMRTFFTYCFLEYKKSVKVLLKSFGSTLMMLLLLIVGAWAVSYFFFHSHIFEPVKVGMVIDQEDDKVKLITKVVSAMESVESICEFVYVDETEAKKLIEKEELAAAIILPKDFYEDVNNGYNTPVKVYVAKEASLNQKVFQELLTDGVSLLRTSEAGVYSMLQVGQEYSAKLSQRKIGNVISDIYISEVLDRSRVFYSEICSALGELDLYEYYFIAVFTLFLLMSGLNYSFLYQKKTRTVEEQLKRFGVGPLKISIIKVVIMTNLLWLLGVIFYGVVCVISCKIEGLIFTFDTSTLIFLIPQCFAIAAYFHMLYTVSSKNGQGAVTVFVVNIFMVLCSGTIVPAAYLPEIVGKIGRYLPLSFWNQYAAQMILGTVDIESLLVQSVIVLTATGIGVAVSWKNT